MKTKCPWTDCTLALLDGDLEGADRDDAIAHVRGCAACEGLAIRLTSDVELMRAATMQGANDGDTVAVRSVLRRRSATRWRTQLVGVAALTAVLSIATVLTREPASNVVQGSPDSIETFAKLNRDLDRLEAMATGFEDLHAVVKRRSDEAFVAEAETAAVLVRAAELLETEYGLGDAAMARYRLASERFGHTEPGKAARLRIDSIVN